VVEGEVRDGLVHTPWGPVVAPAREPAGLVEVVVRPDGARLDPAGPVEATVVRSTFTGTHVELAVISGLGTSGSGVTGSGPGAALTIVVAPASAPVAGDRVRVSIDPDALLVYRRRAD
jgi:iron(III) transport system ATP-binding protein